MILQALVNYYEQLALRGEISKPGWQEAKVSFALNLSGDGGLLNVLPLKTEDRQGKRTVERLPKIQVRYRRKRPRVLRPISSVRMPPICWVWTPRGSRSGRKSALRPAGSAILRCWMGWTDR